MAPLLVLVGQAIGQPMDLLQSFGGCEMSLSQLQILLVSTDVLIWRGTLLLGTSSYTVLGISLSFFIQQFDILLTIAVRGDSSRSHLKEITGSTSPFKIKFPCGI